MGKIFITSDLHLGHDREFIWGARGYKDVHEMNEHIIKNICEVVKTDDELYILGDLILGDIEEGKKFLKRIPGNVHIILGNHDSDKKREFYESLGWDCQWGLMKKINGYSVFMSHWPTLTVNFGLKPLKREVINLCGHHHSTNPFSTMEKEKSICYHVELDAHNNYPIEFNKIIQAISTYLDKNVQID